MIYAAGRQTLYNVLPFSPWGKEGGRKRENTRPLAYYHHSLRRSNPQLTYAECEMENGRKRGERRAQTGGNLFSIQNTIFFMELHRPKSAKTVGVRISETRASELY
jgi:hypothetical protein